MQAQIRTRNRTTDGPLRAARIIRSYTCPRCRQYGEAAPCARCGWRPDAPVQGTNPLAGHEDRIIAC